jgi:hypothetical protein
MPPITIGNIVKLLLACLVVGAALSWLDWTPYDVWAWTRMAAVDLVENASRWGGTVLSYILIGAIVVVPIWLARYVWRALRR